MSKPKTQSEIDTRKPESLLGALREMHRRVGTELEALSGSARLSDEYHDRLAEIYTLTNWLEGLAPDIKTEVERLDSQLPDDLGLCQVNRFTRRAPLCAGPRFFGCSECMWLRGRTSTPWHFETSGFSMQGS